MKITIATPMYGGMAQSEYMQSCDQLIRALGAAGHEVSTVYTVNESLITRARNSLVHEFLKTDYEALLFIDADHSFNAADVVRMVESGHDLIGAAYPMKAINWDAVRQAALHGKPDLHLYSGYYAINFLPGGGEISTNVPLAVRDVGTGMMFIRRRVFEEMAPLCQTYMGNTVGQNMGEKTVEFFLTEIDPDGDILLSEDYAFCARWRRMGNQVFVAPWVRIGHIGHYQFSGNLMNSLLLENEIAAATQAALAAQAEAEQ